MKLVLGVDQGQLEEGHVMSFEERRKEKGLRIMRCARVMSMLSVK